MADEFQTGSFVGMGWSFSSSYIARDTRSSYTTNDDVFSLVMDGAGYDLIKDASGNYHTTQEQYWRIQFTNNQWIVTTKDGTQYQYGISDGSRGIEWISGAHAQGYQTPITYVWWLERVTDTHNNEIRYTYEHVTRYTTCGDLYWPPDTKPYDSGLYPKYIDYNGAGSSFLTRIEFTYSDREDVRAVGTQVQCDVPAQTRKLDRMDVKTTVEGVMQLVRWYEFHYDPNYPLFPGYIGNLPLNHHGRLTLQYIKQHGWDANNTTLSTYTLTYGTNNRLWKVDNGIGGVVSLDYDPAGPLVFTDTNSPRTVWGWPSNTLAPGPGIPGPEDCDNGGKCVNGTGLTNEFYWFGVGTYVPDTHFNFIPGAKYMVDIGVKSEGECYVLMTLWDGVRATPLTGWMRIYTESWYDPVRLQPSFILRHDAADVQIRLSVNGRCAFYGGTGTLYRTYYRVSQQTTSDGQGNLAISPYPAISTYAYEGPAIASHPRSEYQFRGHSKVTVTDPTGAKTEYYFSQEDVWKAGRILRQDQRDPSGVYTYTRTDNEYVKRLTATSTGCTKDPNECPNPIASEQSYFVYTSATTRQTYDRQTTSKSVRTAYSFDDYGNPFQTVESSETGALYRWTGQWFSPNTSKWILNKPSAVGLYDATNAWLKKTSYCYDGSTDCSQPPQKGDVTAEWTGDGTHDFFQWTYGYDPYGNRTSAMDSLYHTTSTEYDTLYHVFPLTITNALGQKTVNAYDFRLGKLLSTTDPNLAKTSYAYDVHGRTTSIWAPLDQNHDATVKYYYTLGSPRSMVHVQVRSDAGGANPAIYQDAWWFYDGLGRVIQKQSAGLNSKLILVNTAYNTRGMTWAVSNPFTVTATGGTYQIPNFAQQPYTEHRYDDVRREINTFNPDRSQRTYGYLQWTTTITDENGHTTKTIADFLGRTQNVLEFNQGQTYTTTYSYDPADRLRIITNNANKTIVMNYDKMGRKTEMFDPDLGHWVYAYDNASNLTQQTDARGCITTLTYDELNRLEGKTYSGPGGCADNSSVAYGYDAFDGANQYGRGRRTSMTDPSGSTTWVYDLQGRMTSQTNAINGAPDLSYTTGWTYDAMDRALSMTYPDNTTVSMMYNVQQQIATLGGFVTGSDYYAANQLKSLTLNNGSTSTYEYDNNLRLTHLQTTLSSSNLQNLSYHYDGVGNVTTLTDTVRVPTEVTSFTYDDRDRLTSATLTGGSYPYSQAWAYDFAGDITSRTDNGRTGYYHYEDTAHTHAVTAVDQTPPGITIRASGNVAGGVWPRMQLWVRGSMVNQWDVTSTSYADYSTSVVVNSEDEVAIVFTNNGAVNGEDRNLFVDYVEINGRVIHPTPDTMVYDLNDSFDGVDVMPGQESLWWTGGLRFRYNSTTKPVIIRAYGTPAGGVWPHMQLWIHRTVSKEWDVTNSSYIGYGVLAALPQGEDVAVVFTNDAFINGQDRNLFVDYVEYGSQVIQAEGGAMVYDRGDPYDGVDVIPGQEAMSWTGGLRFQYAGSVSNPGGTTNYIYNPNGNMTYRAGSWLTYDAENRLEAVFDDGQAEYSLSNGDGQRVARVEYTNGAASVTDTFDADHTETWSYNGNSGNRTVPFGDGGQNVIKINGTGVDWSTGVYRTAYSVTHGQSASIDFKVDAPDTVLYTALETYDGSYARWGLNVTGSKIYVQYADSGQWVYPQDLINPLKLNTWYRVTLRVDDVSGFRIEVHERDGGGASGSYSRLMPAGKHWRFFFGLYRNSAYLDNYVERVNSLTDTFDSANTSTWYLTQYQTVPFNNGQNVLKTTGTGVDYSANFWRNGYALVSGNSISMDFKVTTANTILHVSIDSSDSNVYSRWGVVAMNGKLYAQTIDNGNGIMPEIISSLKTDTWYRVTLRVDDATGFKTEVRERDAVGGSASFSYRMPTGKHWHFASWIYRDTAYLDNYFERTDSSTSTYYIGNWYEVSRSGGTTTPTKYYYFGSQRVAMNRGGAVTYLHGDHLGSTSVTSGASTSTQTYYPFGTVRTTSGTLPTDYTFTGQKLDASAGLLYYGARYYAADLGRFAQPDTIIPDWYNPQSLNRYAYNLNNPIKYIDPTGHCPQPPASMKAVICFGAFIPTAKSASPGRTFQGDDRDFSPDSSPNGKTGSSRFWIWIDPATGEIVNPEEFGGKKGFVHETCLAGGDCQAPDASRNTITSKKNDDGSITVDYHVRCSVDPQCAIGPDGTVTFTPNQYGSFDTSGDTEMFPNLEGYYWKDGQVTTLFQWNFFSQDEIKSGEGSVKTAFNMLWSLFDWVGVEQDNGDYDYSIPVEDPFPWP